MIGFVGCGRMGGPMVRRLVAAGRPVRAFDVDEGALAAAVRGGAERASDPADAASGADAVITMLPDPPAVASAGSELLDGLQRGELWIEMSSSHPATTRALADAAGERGAALLDAPVSGGVRGAEA